MINHVMLVSILDYENCRCRKKLVDKLVEECTKTDEMKLAKIALAEHESRSGYSSCKLYIVLVSILLQLTLELVLILFITNIQIISTSKKMLLMLSLVPTPKQQLNEIINEKYQRN